MISSSTRVSPRSSDVDGLAISDVDLVVDAVHGGDHGDRHEPDEGELNYPYLFRLLDELEYSGWIGCEYRPRAGTSDGLGWLRPWL